MRPCNSGSPWSSPRAPAQNEPRHQAHNLGLHLAEPHRPIVCPLDLDRDFTPRPRLELLSFSSRPALHGHHYPQHSPRQPPHPLILVGNCPPSMARRPRRWPRRPLVSYHGPPRSPLSTLLRHRPHPINWAHRSIRLRRFPPNPRPSRHHRYSSFTPISSFPHSTSTSHQHQTCPTIGPTISSPLPHHHPPRQHENPTQPLPLPDRRHGRRHRSLRFSSRLIGKSFLR